MSIFAEPLTPREFDVLRLIAKGKSNAHIAEMLYIEQRTTEHHIANIFGKMDVAPGTHRRVAASVEYALNGVPVSYRGIQTMKLLGE